MNSLEKVYEVKKIEALICNLLRSIRKSDKCPKFIKNLSTIINVNLLVSFCN